jgi:hypothetical protein
MTVGLIILGYHHDAGGVFIETMDNTRSQHAIDPGKILAVMDQGIDQCPRRISCSRMNDHPRGFVKHDDGWIFIKDRNRKGLGFEGEGCWFR